MKPIIRVENLSKQYRIGAQRLPYQTLRDTFTQTLRKPLSWLNGNGHGEEHTIWALKDVSFDVMPGEVVGVIGRNGAGKSTLLKLLSRITEPTTGRIDLYGRVGSLLEVGTGFHAELTGRENIYLNGAILGMKRAEITRKLDEIIAFAEIEKFIDTPVKHYSSGMYMRLAFAVAAHLEPEILIVDEVLAVGDLSFQQKCLNHLQKLSQGGLTVLLVSHNMIAVQNSSSRVIWMEKGRINAEGQPLNIIEQFRNSYGQEKDDRNLYFQKENSCEPSKQPVIQINRFEMFGEDGTRKRDFLFGEKVKIRIELYASRPIDNPFINFGVRRSDGVIVCNFNNWYDNFKLGSLEGHCILEGWLPELRIIPNVYEAHVLVWPWGGGHGNNDITTLSPLAAETFGSFAISGLGLNAHDGVFQTPAIKWRFTGSNRSIETDAIDKKSIYTVLQNID